MRSLPFILIGSLLTAPTAAQVSYDVSFPNAAHHETVIAVTVDSLSAGPVLFRMSRASPGRYAIHEFAKNVYDVSATGGRGQELVVTRPDPYQWKVTGHDGTVTLTYTLFADRADGTYSQVGRTHAHLNMPSAFMWVVGQENTPIDITFHPPPDSEWKAATQLVPGSAPMTFAAPDLQYFMDSPTELSDYSLRQWTVTSGGRTDTIRIAMHHTGTEAELDAYTELAKRVVEQEVEVFGETARFDHGVYTFIADYVPWATGDGMEHRNSTIISSSTSLADNRDRLLGTLAHEFFHSWNVERIRPDGLEPFDFTRANMSAALWFAEGFTSYYGPLSIRRAGIQSVEGYAHGLSRALDFVINSPARQFFSPMEMSMQAPFVDAATSIDPVNRGNTFISYYTWGSVLGLALDLTLRAEFDKTLDGFMRLMWKKYGVTGTPYTVDDLEATLAEYTGDRAFAKEFFDRFIRGSEVPDYEALLSHAGLLLRQSNPGAAFAGPVSFSFDSAGAVISSYTQIGTPLYEAGLGEGDIIVSVNGKALNSDQEWEAILDSTKPGDVLEMVVEQRGVTQTVEVTLAEDPSLEVVTYEEAGREVTEEMREFRDAWLGTEP